MLGNFKKMKRILGYLFVLCVAWSCQYDFEVSSPVQEDRMFVECIAGLDEDNKSFLSLRRCTPIGKPAVSGANYSLESLRLNSNGEQMDYSRVIKEGDPFVSFAFDEAFNPGDVLDLNVVVQGMPELNAKTIVPPIPSSTISMEDAGGRLIVRIRLDGFVDDNAGFAFTCVDPETDSPYDITSDSDDESLTSMLSSRLKIVYYGDKRLCIFRGADLNNAEYVFVMGKQTAKYKITLMSLSEEAYGYLNAKYNQENNYLGMLGLSPPNFAYSNISGGYGVLGAVSKVSKTFEF